MNSLSDRKISYLDLEMILVGNHAPFTWGKTPEKAVYNSGVLEAIAKMAYLTERIFPEASRLKNSLINKHFERKNGSATSYGQC